MKKSLRNTLAITMGVGFTLILASCNSFCSVTDTSNFRYAYDPINTTFYSSKDAAYEDLLTEFQSSSGLSSDLLTLDELEFVDDEEGNVSYSENKEEFEKRLFKSYNDNESLISINAGQLRASLKVNEEDENETTYYMYVGLNDLNIELFNNAQAQGYIVPSYSFINELDQKTLSLIVETANSQMTIIDSTINEGFSNLTFEDLYGYTSDELEEYKNLENGSEKSELLEKMQAEREDKSILANYGYLKHYSLTTDENGNETVDYYKNVNDWNNEIAEIIGVNSVMTNNFMNAYQTSLNNKVANVRTCITVEDGYYGNLTNDPLNNTVKIEGKAVDFWQGWGEAFTKHGFLEGLLVYPIAIGVENLSHAFGMNGWGQIGAVLLMTLIVRFLFMAVTFPSTLSQQKMSFLQPEIAKLQQKYPNSNTNEYDKQRFAQAQMALYKKHKVHPFMSLLVIVIQFPLFICVWNALQGSASLATDAVLGLNLSDSIWSVLSNFAGWPSQAGWWTALVLIILMSASQIVSMLLPQWLNKKRNKNVAKTVNSEAMNKSQRTMKITQWVMTIFVIFMGFTLPAAMGVYWFAGAIFSILQSLILHLVFIKRGVK